MVEKNTSQGQGKFTEQDLALMKEKAFEAVENSAKLGSVFAGFGVIVPFLSFGFILGACANVIDDVNKVYGIEYDKKAKMKLAQELAKASVVTVFGNMAAMAALNPILSAMATTIFLAPAVMAAQGGVAWLIVRIVGYTYCDYCANQMEWEKPPEEILTVYARQNVNDFLSSLKVQKIRDAIKKKMNPDIFK